MAPARISLALGGFLFCTACGASGGSANEPASSTSAEGPAHESNPDGPRGEQPAWAAFDEQSGPDALAAYAGVWVRGHVVPVTGHESDDVVHHDTFDCVAVGVGDDGSGTVEINTVAPDLHACAIHGRGGVNADGNLVVKTADDCWALVRRLDDGLRIEGVWPDRCELEYCGARDVLHPSDIPESGRTEGTECPAAEATPRTTD